MSTDPPSRSARAVATPPAALRPGWRAFAISAIAASRSTLLLVLWLVVTLNDPPVTPPLLVELVVVFALLPALAAALVRRAFRAEVRVVIDTLEVRRADLHADVPCALVSAVELWWLPLPGHGLSLRLRTGGLFRYGLWAEDPTPLLAALADEGGVQGADAARRDWRAAYARARAAGRPRGAAHALLKFVAFAFLPAAVLFNAHQHIAFGGPLGEYYLVGAGAWLRTLAVYWLTTAIYLVLFAAAWRAPAEAIAIAATRVAPGASARIRGAVEVGCAIAYYAGVPIALAIRFWP
ncbi:MAG TPA: hypothetical protein VFD84_00500 [Candidatus Binatia bacterium]|nr:hypothetical protein [Candidatus Binatia bacterium]